MIQPPTRQETVLVIEDDPTLRMGLRATLRSEGFRVIVANDGPSGLEAALSERPDLVLLDVMLPGMNGFEVLETIRQRNADLPILMLTAKGQEEDRVRGLRLGADDYIVKPFGIAELIARVEANLRRIRREEAQSATVRIGDVTIDLSSHQAQRDGQAITLTALEVRLLRYFLSRDGRVLSRQQILDAVWGADYYGTDRTVDNFINRLRGIIEPNAKTPRFLVTVRGAGYRFSLTGK